MALFSNRQESNLRSCIGMIEDVIENLGHAPDQSRVETEDVWPAWRIQKGSAQVNIEIRGRGDDNVLRVSAPLLPLSGAKDPGKLCRRLLELNARDVTGAAFALDDGKVVVTAERSTVDLDRSEAMDIVRRVVDYAVHYLATLPG